MKPKQNAFTLLEIVVAVALIAIFVTLPVLAYSSYLKRSRDTRRKADLNQVGAALQMYKATKGTYPADLNELVQDAYLPTLPKDPKEGQIVPGMQGVTYGYEYDSTDDQSTYMLTAKLEGEVGAGTVNASEGDDGFYVVTPLGSTIVSGYPTPSVPVPTSTLIIQNTPLPTYGASPTPTTAVPVTASVTPSPTGAQSLPDLTIENMSRTPSEGYRAYLCNRGTGSSMSTYVVKWKNDSTGQEFTSPGSSPYTVPEPNTCEWSGNLTCSLIGSTCSDPIDVTASIDAAYTVTESDEGNNQYTSAY